MIDLERVKGQADLLTICGHDTGLKRVASTNGGEWAGPCPFCLDRGRDRFRVQPYAKPYPLWMCRHCNDRWDTVIGYIARRDNLDPKIYKDLEEICKRVVGGDIPTTNQSRPEPPPTPAYQPPVQEWRAAAHQVIEECKAALWDPKYHAALDYLRGRGLSDATIKRFDLGYCATGKREVFGREISGLYVQRGILIPCVVSGMVWYLKTRLLPGVPCVCTKCREVMPGPGICPKCGEENKYRGVKGNQSAAIFNADALRKTDIALFSEGEFDCMIADQLIGDVIPTVTLGGSTNRIDLATWGMYLLPLRVMLAVYDTDKPGQKGAEALAEVSNRVRRLSLPAGHKDINDFVRSGNSFADWTCRAILSLVDREAAAENMDDYARLMVHGMTLAGEDPFEWAKWAESEHNIKMPILQSD